MKHLSKRLIPLLCLILAAALVLAGCGGGSSSSEASEPKDYAEILRNARTDEYNEYFEVVTGPDDDTIGILDFLAQSGFAPEAMEQYAISVSLMNTKAYAVMIIKPAEGQEEAIRTAMQDYIQMQQDSFEFYLADQYEIAQDAQLETAPSGELILVMSEDAADVLQKIEDGLK